MLNLPKKCYIGVLLAAGRGRRFDPLGERDKLRQSMPDGRGIAQTAAANLLEAVETVVAVVRPDAPALALELEALGCTVVVCHDAADGMGNSLRCGLQVCPADGWVIALADMPRVRPSTIAALFEALRRGADIVAPICEGRRGNPVGFAARHLPELLEMSGDEGARRLLKKYVVTEIDVDDPGVHQDVDCAADLRQLYS